MASSGPLAQTSSGQQSSGSTSVPPQAGNWRKYYADDNLQSTEVKLLQKEGESLEKVLKKAFPNDQRNTWSYHDLETAVQDSRNAYEAKERMGQGKPQRLFHSLMRKFDSHSRLFSFVPSGSQYTSIVVGAVTVLVKASVNHSKTIETLSDALDSITDSIALCDVSQTLIRSALIQSAIAKLYIKVFLFFGDAIVWYNSSAAKKVLHSLHNDFSEKFRDAITAIHVQAAAVRNVAQFGTQAEIRDIHSDVEDIRAELNDARIGLSGELRNIVEQVYRQHNDNLKQHELTQRLLEETRMNMMPLANPQLAQLMMMQGSQIQQHLALPEVAQPIEMVPNHEIRDRLDQLVQAHASKTGCQPSTIPVAPERLFDDRLSRAINKWLSPASTTSLLCIEHQSDKIGDKTEIVAGFRVEAVCEDAKIPAIIHVQQAAQSSSTTITDNGKGTSSNLVCMVLDLAAKIVALLPPDDEEPESFWSSAEIVADKWISHEYDISFQQACDVLTAVLSIRPANLHIIVAGDLAFRHASAEDAGVFVSTMRTSVQQRTEEASGSLKVLMLTRHKLQGLSSCLDSTEIAVVPLLARNKKPTKAAIAIHG